VTECSLSCQSNTYSNLKVHSVHSLGQGGCQMKKKTAELPSAMFEIPGE